MLKLVLPVRVVRKGEALFGIARGLEAQKLAGEVQGGLFGSASRFVPIARAEFSQLRLSLTQSDVACE